jgi:hypothetical protein
MSEQRSRRRLQCEALIELKIPHQISIGRFVVPFPAPSAGAISGGRVAEVV